MLGHGTIGQFAIGEADFGAGWSWFAALSEPVRARRGLPAGAHLFCAPSPLPFPPWGWLEPLSEPKRFKPGLASWHQQFLAYHPRILPTPTITGTMNLIETKDTMLAGGTEFNRPVTAKVGFIENAFSGIAGLIERSS